MRFHINTRATLTIIAALILVSYADAQTTRPSGPERGDVKDGEASLQAKVNALASTLQSARQQLELYRLQHNGYPTTEQFKDWKVLLKLTTATGEIVEGQPKAGAEVWGPYLLYTPTNALTMFTKVSDAKNIDAETGWATRKTDVGPYRNVDYLYAVVPDTPAMRQLIGNVEWVIFSDKVR